MFRILRNHLHFVVTVGILIMVMTWPTIVHVFDTTVFWLPSDNNDIWIEFWNAWYSKLILAGEADFYFTDLSFYPDGLPLNYHVLSIPPILAFGGLQTIMPASNAYNLTYLLIIFSTALSAYVYLLYLLKDKWISLFGAVIFGLSGYIFGRPPHPALSFIATLPLTLYFFHRAILEKRGLFIGISGALIGLTAFVGPYIYVITLLTLGLYILYFACSRWRNPNFWLRITLLFVIVGSISLFRVYPMIADSRALEDVLNKSHGREYENDLLQYFINYEHPIVNHLITNQTATGAVQLADPSWRWNTSYLGYVPLFLIGFGIFSVIHRRKMLPWLLLILPFLTLRLGSALKINTQEYPDILLPKHYLDEIIPAVFEGFYTLGQFQPGVLLPLAMLSCYGLIAFLQSVSAQRRPRIILICIALVAFEYYRIPKERIVPAEEIAFLDWLRLEEDQDSIRLINLPMGRLNSKQYLFYQTLSGYPQVEGLAIRTPSDAYTYIKENHLLNAWHTKSSLQCISHQAKYLSALNDLINDGFSHVILHHSSKVRRVHGQFPIRESFIDAPPSYEDEFATIYRLEDLRGSCFIIQNYDMVLRELTDAQSSFAVLYDSDILLFNLPHEIDSDQMTFSFWWARTSDDPYAFSIQIFNVRGEKVQQYDNVIGIGYVHAVDISMLAEGDYAAKLIVYDFDTHVSQPGIVLDNQGGFQGQFERELEIARFTIRE